MTDKFSRRIKEEVAAVRRLSAGRVAARILPGNKVLVALPGPTKSVWAAGLYSIVISYPKG